MQCCSFSYTFSENVGDEIQSLAAEQYLPRVDRRIDRDSLNCRVSPHVMLVIMNGWFTKFAQNWPPAANIRPLYFGFHLAPFPAVIEPMLSPASLEHFRRFEPIGCRDVATQRLLEGAGINAFYSKCLTLTFPTRDRAPQNGQVFLVDIPDDLLQRIPPSLRRGAVPVSHAVQDIYGEQIKFAIASELLDQYRRRARLVITTRLHCALPCLAMGIPVIFFGNPAETRISVASSVGLKIYPPETESGEVNWEPTVLDIEEEKAAIAKQLRQLLQKYLNAREP